MHLQRQRPRRCHEPPSPPLHPQVKFKDLFDSFDADRSGTLEIRELAQLVKRLVPKVTVAELKYIMVCVFVCVCVGGRLRACRGRAHVPA